MTRLTVLFLILSVVVLPSQTVSTAQSTTPTVVPKVVIRFSAPVNDYTVRLLMNTLDGYRKAGTTEFVILISSPGGAVHAGIAAYNYLKAMPAPVKVTTHNFGIVDSIGVILFCGGSKRLSVPQARFLIHGAKLQVSGATEIEEKGLEEALKSLKVDSDNIAKVLAANSNKPVAFFKEAMHERTALTPDQAKELGLIHDIKPELYNTDDPVFYIDGAPPKQ